MSEWLGQRRGSRYLGGQGTVDSRKSHGDRISGANAHWVWQPLATHMAPLPTTQTQRGAGRRCPLACLQAPPSAGLFLLFAQGEGIPFWPNERSLSVCLQKDTTESGAGKTCESSATQERQKISAHPAGSSLSHRYHCA